MTDDRPGMNVTSSPFAKSWWRGAIDLYRRGEPETLAHLIRIGAPMNTETRIFLADLVTGKATATPPNTRRKLTRGHKAGIEFKASWTASGQWMGFPREVLDRERDEAIQHYVELTGAKESVVRRIWTKAFYAKAEELKGAVMLDQKPETKGTIYRMGKKSES